MFNYFTSLRNDEETNKEHDHTLRYDVGNSLKILHLKGTLDVTVTLAGRLVEISAR